MQVDLNQETSFKLVDMNNGKVLWKTKERLSNGWPLYVAGELKMTHDAACGGTTLCMTLRTTLCMTLRTTLVRGITLHIHVQTISQTPPEGVPARLYIPDT